MNVIPEYIRNDYCTRSKLYVGLKLSSETDLLSKFLAHFVLINSIPHVFEKVNQPTDLDTYINFVPENVQLIDYIDDVLTKNKNDHLQLNDNFNKYKDSKNLKITTIFENLSKFFILS